jgi:multidrug efflux pump subunit AcrA (membrane-fusion protein)
MARILFKWIASLALLALLGAGGVIAFQRLAPKPRVMPVVKVIRGDVGLRVFARGEVQALKSRMIVAPPVGGVMKIVSLAKTGSIVNAGDVVVEFDPSEQQHNLEQSQSELAQAEQEIARMKADAAVQAADETVTLLRARFDVRRAELEVGRNELVGAIEARKNSLNLEEARRRLEQLEKDAKTRLISKQADLAVMATTRARAQMSMQMARKNIENMQVRSPIDGLVSVKENYDASGGFMYTGMILPEYREGDQVYPGRSILQVLDVETMEIQAKINEEDRANIVSGQRAEVFVDAVVARPLPARVKSVANVASRSSWMDAGTNKFECAFQFDTRDARLRPGITAEAVVLTTQLKQVLHLPRQAVFEKAGKPVVYVKTADGLSAQEIKVKYRTESHAVIEGLDEGTEVTLVNPEEQKKGSKAAAGPQLSGGGR